LPDSLDATEPQTEETFVYDIASPDRLTREIELAAERTAKMFEDLATADGDQPRMGYLQRWSDALKDIRVEVVSEQEILVVFSSLEDATMWTMVHQVAEDAIAAADETATSRHSGPGEITIDRSA
jgi:hypothetical protein